MKSMKWIGVSFVIWLVIAACCAFAGLPFIGEIPLRIVFGWIDFVYRTLPNIELNWASAGLAAISLVALLVGVQRLGVRWMRYRSRQRGMNDGPWRFRWTGSLVAGLLLAFTAGISVLGAVHQLVWIVTREEPFVESDGFHLSGRTQSRNHLKQIGLAVHNYSDTHGLLPPGVSFDEQGRAMHSTLTMLLPFIEQQGLYSSIDLNLPWNDISNQLPFQTRIPGYEFPPQVPNPEMRPRRDMLAPANYAGNIRLLMPGSAMSFRDINDGTSNTILAGEVMAGLRPWGDPLNLRDPAKGVNKGPEGYSSPFHGGVNVLFADGSTRFLSSDTEPGILKALSTPAGAEPLADF
ncbi:MAG: DUF1559 domain-containing protein [Planctomycetaceae bacterium]|nr:DUF1559 domain-containing protein [Planctomycetaceae bacterium]